MTTQAYTIEASAKAFKILSDNIYTDKILAVVRELSCNAWDSHIDANNADKPFDVYLGKIDDLNNQWVFYIRDYGTGMSDEMVMHLYSTYFASTKSNGAKPVVLDQHDWSDRPIQPTEHAEPETAPKAVGHLGLGSKSPFSYTDRFTITSFFDGVATSYVAFMDDNGLPSITRIGESATSEANGLKISVKVKYEDVNDFTSRMYRVYQHFPVCPNFIGSVKPHFYHEPELVTVGGYRYSIRNAQTRLSAIQGVVGYDVSVYDTILTEYKWHSRYAFDIHFPVGDLDIAPSREHLSLDRQTLANLNNGIRTVAEHAQKTATDLVSEIENRYEAIRAYRNHILFPHFIPIHEPTGMSLSEPFSLNIGNDHPEFFVVKKDGKKKWYPISDNHWDMFKNDHTVVIDDLGTRVKGRMDEINQGAFLIRSHSRKAMTADELATVKSWLGKNFPGLPFSLISSIEPRSSYYSGYRTPANASSGIYEYNLQGHPTEDLSYTRIRNRMKEIDNPGVFGSDTLVMSLSGKETAGIEQFVKLHIPAIQAGLVKHGDIKLYLVRAKTFDKLKGVAFTENQIAYPGLKALVDSLITQDEIDRIGLADSLIQMRSTIRLPLMYIEYLREFDEDIKLIYGETTTAGSDSTVVSGFMDCMRLCGRDTTAPELAKYKQATDRIIQRYWFVNEFNHSWIDKFNVDRFTRLKPTLRIIYDNRTNDDETVAVAVSAGAGAL